MMYNNSFDRAFDGVGQHWWGLPLIGGFAVIAILVMVWTLVWKGLALWKAARSGSKVWFVVLLLVNTLGILDILYIYVFSKKGAIQKIIAPAEPIKEEHHQS